MKALTLHQPWATLCITRAATCPRCRHAAHGAVCLNMASDNDCACTVETSRAVKWIETRSWPAPASLIGQRIAIHASKEPPPSCLPDGSWPGYHDERGWWTVPDDRPGHVDLPLGAVVGSAVLTACVPMLDVAESLTEAWTPHLAPDFHGRWWHWIGPSETYAASTGRPTWRREPIDDQRPFGIFEPGRYAWLLADAAPTTERCPWCWGDGEVPERVDRPVVRVHVCPVCSGAGRCDPIPARGRQRVWEWAPCG